MYVRKRRIHGTLFDHKYGTTTRPVGVSLRDPTRTPEF
jgi:hypothetical protein